LLVDNVDLAARNGARMMNFGFRDPGNRLPYQVRSITGLDADEIVMHFVGNSSTDVDCPSFNIPTLVKREITLLLGLNPDWGVSQNFSTLRDDLYRLIGACPSGQVQIRFNYGTSIDDSHVQAYLIGRISKIEANHFVDRPEVQLTITADEYPMLEALTYTEVTSPSWGVQPGLATPSSVLLTDEVSTSPHGMELLFAFSNTTSNFKMEGLSNLEGLLFEIDGFNFLAGDLLAISTRPDARAVYVLRGTTITHLLDKVTAESIWPLMLPGR
jgi:hypothetical protein